jgi:hypothetical protein
LVDVTRPINGLFAGIDLRGRTVGRRTGVRLDLL